METSILIFLLLPLDGLADLLYRARAIKGTSGSSCDFGVNDEAVWGAKLGFQEKFQFYNGEGNSCPPINVNDDGPQTFFEETFSCDDQLAFFEVCVLAGDFGGGTTFGCDEVTEETLDCQFIECREVSLDRCFREDCGLSQDIGFDVVNSIVDTRGVEIVIERSGNCATATPTANPTELPTEDPTPGPTNPTPSPTFGCSGTLGVCGGPPGFVGPTCCIAGHVCVQSEDSSSLICKIDNREGDSNNEVSLVLSAGALFGLCMIALTCRLFIGAISDAPVKNEPELRASNRMFQPESNGDDRSKLTQSDKELFPDIPGQPSRLTVGVEGHSLSFSKPQTSPSYEDMTL